MRLLPRSTPTLRIRKLDNLGRCKHRKLQRFVQRLNNLSACSCNIAFATATATDLFRRLGDQLTCRSFYPGASRRNQCDSPGAAATLAKTSAAQRTHDCRAAARHSAVRAAHLLIPGRGTPTTDPTARFDADRRYLDDLLAGRASGDPRIDDPENAGLHAQNLAKARLTR